MKVLLAGNWFPPEFVGGTERILQALATGLVEQGDVVDVVCGSEGPSRTEVIDGVRVHRIARSPDEGYGIVVHRPLWLAQFEQLLQRLDPDVVHVHHWSHTSDRLLQVARAAGKPGVATLHDMWTHCPRFFRLPPVGSAIVCPQGIGRDECVACANLDYHDDPARIRAMFAARGSNLEAECGPAVLTAPSRSCAEAFARHSGLATPVRVIPHGLLREVDRAQPPSGARSRLRIGTFGNQGAEKGTLDLVRAAAGLPVDVLISGGFVDPLFERELVRQAAALGLSMRLCGRYDDDRHPAKDLDLAVFPSRCEETYGLVVDEALAHGVPVLVSARGALPERVAAGGGLVVDEPGQLRSILSRLVREPKALEDLRQSIPERLVGFRTALLAYRDIYRQLLPNER